MSIKNTFTVKADQIMGSKTAMLHSVEPSYVYNDGKRGLPNGIKLSVIAYGNGMELVDVKLPGIMDIGVTKEQIDEHAKRMEFILVSFDDIVVTPYVRDNRSVMSYKTNKATVVGVVKLAADSKAHS